MSNERCTATTDSGERCAVDFGLCDEPGCDRCFQHCPHRAEERKQARQRGAETTNEKAREGKVRTVPSDEAPPPPKSADEASHWLSWAIWAVSTGRVDARTCHEIAYTCRAFLKALDKAELSDRVEELEAKLAELRRQGMGAA